MNSLVFSVRFFLHQKYYEDYLAQEHESIFLGRNKKSNILEQGSCQESNDQSCRTAGLKETHWDCFESSNTLQAKSILKLQVKTPEPSDNHSAFFSY
ncbi:MAG: hypothetical protein SO135_05595 [Sphaerochaetaceae bacterium]|nr:hypothetical protein [Sphaerochaetaceae bacterium]